MAFSISKRAPITPPQIDDRAFKPYFRACDRVEKLCVAGLITPHELRAAHAFRRLYDLAYAGPGGLRAANLAVVRVDKHCRRPLRGMSEGQAAAIGRLRRIKDALRGL